MSASAARIDCPVSTRMSSSANTSFGFAIATTIWPLQRSTGSAQYAARDLFGDHAREQDVGRVRLEVDERDAEVVGEGLRELEAGDRADVDERFAETLAGRALVLERLRRGRPG